MKKLDFVLMKLRGDNMRISFTRDEAEKIAKSLKIDFIIN